MQSLMVIAGLEYFREYYDVHGDYPSIFSEFLLYLSMSVLLTTLPGSQQFANSVNGHLPLAPYLICVPTGLVDQWMTEAKRFLANGTFAILPYVGMARLQPRKEYWDVFESTDYYKTRRIILAAQPVSPLSDNC